ncbi:MAG: hypothetical protein Q4A74_08675 [Cardiobacteriaceae bacterium]|nr:hypothetical protein [Cardiobacteriaceae bacterium]
MPPNTNTSIIPLPLDIHGRLNIVIRADDDAYLLTLMENPVHHNPNHHDVFAVLSVQGCWCSIVITYS